MQAYIDTTTHILFPIRLFDYDTTVWQNYQRLLDR